MRFGYALGLALLFSATLQLTAQRADESYVAIYHLIQQADALVELGKDQDAVKKYMEARSELLNFRGAHPKWNEKVVGYRLDYIDSRLSILAPSGPATNAPAAAMTSTEGSEPAMNQLHQLREQLRLAQSQNALLEAKLREALSARPAAADPRELAKAETKVRDLEKERDLLMVTLEQLRTKISVPIDSRVEATERQVLSQVRDQLARQIETNGTLLEENEALRRQAAQARVSSANADLSVELQFANETLAALRATNITLRTERIMLDQRLREASTIPSTAGLSRRDSAELEQQLAVLRARMGVYEAKEVPYSPEELALFEQPPLNVSITDQGAARKKVYQVPPGAGPLMERARLEQEKGQLEAAEGTYQEVLRQDEQNVFTLANLAGVQMELRHWEKAEQTLNKALSVDPQDAPSLFLLGVLRFERGDYDKALDALSLSAQILPNEARTHYYLGKTLVQKGNRGPAETALRRAVQLKPKWGEAHHLLAVVYATQQPPFVELAQWHYQKALDSGAPQDAELEKWLERLKLPAQTP